MCVKLNLPEKISSLEGQTEVYEKMYTQNIKNMAEFSMLEVKRSPQSLVTYPLHILTANF